VYLVSQLESGLDGLCEVELLQLLREIAGGRRFAFRHPLIQEVAYGTQLKARRANLHAAVAVAMETHYSAQPGEFAALIAYHYEAAGQFFNAAQHEALAAKWTGSTNSAQAIKHWRRVWTLLDGQERSSPVNSLRALAGGRIVYLGWREGLSPQDVEQITHEAIEHASQVDNRLVQLLLFAQGRIRQSSGGSADDYVACILKALSLTPPGKDIGRVAMLNVALSQAYAWAGLLEQGLMANDAALLGITSIDQFDREFLDFSVEQWVLGIRARLLIRMGRFDSARMCLQRMLSADEGLHDPVIGQIAHHLSVELASYFGEAMLAQEHSLRVSKISQEHRSPYSRVFALWCSGLADVANGDLDSAYLSYSEALALVRVTRVGVEFETEIQVSLAESHYKAGQFEQAWTCAQEAVVLSQHRSNRLAECRALIVLGGVMGQKTEASSQEEASALLDQAEHLIHMTGAKIYQQGLLSERGRSFLQVGR
jgi:adenylate cyclase